MAPRAVKGDPSPAEHIWVHVWPFDDRRQAFDQRARRALVTSRRWQAAGVVAAVAMAAADCAEPVAWSVRGGQLAALAAVCAACAAGVRRGRRRISGA